jgi:hypothetical protein
MPNPSTRFTPLDPGRVNRIDPEELAYWSRELQCSEPELTQAVSSAGEHVAAVREYLAAQKKAS